MITRRKLAVPLLGLSVASSVVVNLLQARRILVLEQRVSRKPLLQAGGRLPVLRLRDLTNREMILDFSGGSKPSILYSFSPSCRWCYENTERINMLARLVSNHYRVVGVAASTDGLNEYLKMKPLNFPVYTLESPASAHAYGFNATPATIVLAENGTVLDSWIGAFVGNTRSSVESYFSISLPDT